MKRFFAILLALMMIMSLATTVFADDGLYTVTIVNNVEGHLYEAYQIFTGDLSNEDNPDASLGGLNNPNTTNAVLSNVQWGASVINANALNAAGNTAAVVAKKLADKEMTTDELLELITLDQRFYANATGEKHNNTILYTLTGLPAGYYLIKDANGRIPSTNHDAYTEFILEVVENSEIMPKSSVPTVDKSIGNGLSGTNLPDVNEAGVGEKVEYTITPTLATNIANYNEYFFRFTDTLSPGLTYNGDLKVWIGTTDMTSYFYTNATQYSETDGTTITVAIQDLLALENLTDKSIKFDGESQTPIINITYSATVNANALINEPNTNKVYLEYSNNPNDSGEGTTTPPPTNPSQPTPTKPIGKTPESEVETCVTEVIINKVDGNGNALKGAEFKIVGDAKQVIVEKQGTFTEDANGTYWKLKNGTYTTTQPVFEDNPATNDVNEKNSDYYADTTTKYKATTVEVLVPDSPVSANFSATAEVDESGKLVFSGLGAGTYTITETKTPAGYNTIAAPIGLEISFDAATKEFSYTWTNATADADNAASIDVINQAGSTLPETGGVGTTLFYIFGGLMMVGAVVLLVTKKRMAN